MIQYDILGNNHAGRVRVIPRILMPIPLGWVNIAAKGNHELTSLEPTAVAKKHFKIPALKSSPTKFHPQSRFGGGRPGPRWRKIGVKKTPPINRDEWIGKTVFFLVNGSFTFQIRKEEGNL